MSHSPELKAEIVELVYDLLSEKRADELRARIANEPEVADLFEQVRRKASMIADAARLTTGKSLFGEILPSVSGIAAAVENPLADDVVPVQGQKQDIPAQPETQATEIPLSHSVEADMPSGTVQVAHAGHERPQVFRLMPWEFAKRAFLQERRINRVMSAAAVCLVVMTVCGYFYQRYQVSRVAGMPYRVVAAAPELLVKGTPQTLQVQVTDLLGERRQVPVRVAINNRHGNELASLVESTGPDGKLLVPLAKLTEHLETVDDSTVQLEISTGNASPDNAVKSIATLRLAEKPFETPGSFRRELAAVNRYFDASSLMSQPEQIAESATETPGSGIAHYSMHNAVAEAEVRPYVLPQQLRKDMLESDETPRDASEPEEPVGTPAISNRSNQLASNSQLYFPQTSQSYVTPPRSASDAALATMPSSAPMTPPDVTQDSFAARRQTSETRALKSLSAPQPQERMARESAPNAASSAFGVFGATGQDAREKASRKPETAAPVLGNANQKEQSDADVDARESSEVYGQLRTRRSAVLQQPDASDMGGGMSGGMASGSSGAVGYGGGGMSGSGFSSFGGSGGMGMASSPEIKPEKPSVTTTDATLDAMLDITLSPEGGRLVTGLENRVFFRATVAREPVRNLAGTVTDDRGRKVAELECAVDGYGRFYLKPQTGRHYTLSVNRWETASRRSGDGEPFTMAIALPESDAPLNMGLARHVVSTDEPVTVHLRSRRAGLPVVVTVSQNGVPLLSEPAVTGDGVTSVRVPLPQTVTGFVEVSVFDAESGAMSPLGTERALRRPVDWLTVKANAASSTHNDQTTWQVELQVTDADGRHVADADVAVRVMQTLLPEETADALFAAVPTSTGLQLLGRTPGSTNQSIDRETLESLLTSNDAETLRTFDFFVAADDSLRQDAQRDMRQSPTLRPVMLDNMAALQAHYDQTLEGVRQSRRTWGFAVGMVVVFGGMALAVLSMILVVMRLASGSRMFVVAAVSGLACVFVCMVMLRGQNGDDIALSNRPTYSAPEQSDSKNKTSTEVPADADSAVDYFILSETFRDASSAPPDANRRFSGGLPLECAYENLSLRTDGAGCVRFELTLPANPKPSLYLVADVSTKDNRPGFYRVHFNKIAK